MPNLIEPRPATSRPVDASADMASLVNLGLADPQPMPAPSIAPFLEPAFDPALLLEPPGESE
ncbi:hypothetical protein [Streptomyces uncialis]|uniref:Uncharacterized protein n=1 Tax=Streptomyces uncialis TaxID=1048205 RepID=A0A1Q4V125_9ACTN|nr:hypothetical protein [Streptomyces uncialis]OKH91514.1 hypothetical protein AB852_28580 [Streptomyces uncialis]